MNPESQLQLLSQKPIYMQFLYEVEARKWRRPWQPSLLLQSSHEELISSLTMYKYMAEPLLQVTNTGGSDYS